MRKLVTLLLAGLLVLAFSAPAFAHDGKVHGKNMSSPGHSSVNVADKGMGKGKGKGKGSDDNGAGAASSSSKKRITLVFVGTVVDHRRGTSTTAGEFDVKFHYGNSAAANFVQRTDATVSFSYSCLRYVGGPGTSKSSKDLCKSKNIPKDKWTQVATSGKKLKNDPTRISDSSTRDPQIGDLVVVQVQDPRALADIAEPLFPKNVTIKRKGAQLEGVIHSLNTTTATLELAIKGKNHVLVNVNKKDFTKILIDNALKALDDLKALVDGRPHDAVRAHVILKAGTNDAVLIRARSRP